jgi:ketosteroid isomerase-like protein
MIDNILSLEELAMERWRQGDPMGYVEITGDDIIYVDPGLSKPITGLSEYGLYMQQLTGLIHYDRSEFIFPKVVMVGDAALLTFNYRSSVLTPEGNISSQTPWNSTEVFFMREGEWKIVHSHWSYINQRPREKVEIPIPVHSEKIMYEGILAELMAIERGAMERWRKGDPQGYLERYDPDITYFDVGSLGRINGQESLRGLYSQLEGQIFFEVMDFVEPFVLVSGNLAVLFYRFISTKLNDDGSVLNRTPWNCTEVYQRKQGSWRIIHNHWSFIMGERN